jgi:hypothetical protein
MMQAETERDTELFRIIRNLYDREECGNLALGKEKFSG